MPRLDSASSVSQQTGAANTVRHIWPNTLSGVTTLQPSFAVAKLGIALTTIAIGGIGGGTQTANIRYKGQHCTRLNSTAGTGYYITSTLQPHFFTERTVAPMLDDLCCWSLRIICAFANPAGAMIQDCGLQVTTGVQAIGTWRTAGKGGIGFYVTNTQQLSLVASAAGAGITVNEVLSAANQPDITQWHALEFQFISGLATADPYLQGFIDGVAVTARYSFTAAAGLLPDPTVNGGTPTFQVGIVNNSNAVVSSVYVSRVMLTGARTQADLF